MFTCSVSPEHCHHLKCHVQASGALLQTLVLAMSTTLHIA